MVVERTNIDDKVHNTVSLFEIENYQTKKSTECHYTCQIGPHDPDFRALVVAAVIIQRLFYTKLYDHKVIILYDTAIKNQVSIIYQLTCLQVYSPNVDLVRSAITVFTLAQESTFRR